MKFSPLSFVLGVAAGMVVAVLVLAVDGDAHLLRLPDHPNRSVLENRLAQQNENLYHSRYVCRNGKGPHVRLHCVAARGWLLRERNETREALQPRAWWVSKQIRIAEKIGSYAQRHGLRDPWPNCPDPFDNGGYSWSDTLACESPTMYARYGPSDPRAWLDPPGYYRCGLQFDPDLWETKYGKLCP